MDPKSFTLGSMFAMRLDHYAEDVGHITSAAQKELTIETELRKVADIWRDRTFDIVKYSKGAEDRGYILRGVDDITLLLDDIGLSLQSMTASPFVRPFAEEVRKWEQQLGLVAETIEAWLAVQRKWMYLESVFVGSADIRQQLPQVCTLFACCTRTYTHTHSQYCPSLP